MLNQVFIEKKYVKNMIHPSIKLVFPDNDQTVLLFSWLCQKMNNVDDLEEFVRWHLETLNITIKEIILTNNVELSDIKIAKTWARSFLANYEEKIRSMRTVSNQVYDKFHHLNNTELKRIIVENKDKEDEIKNLFEIFLNKKELLIGKIIFAYRETWFLAKQITNPDLTLSSVKEFQKWVDSNFFNLNETKKSLEKIYMEILKWKE